MASRSTTGFVTHWSLFGLSEFGPFAHDRVTVFHNKATGISTRPPSDSSFKAGQKKAWLQKTHWGQ